MSDVTNLFKATVKTIKTKEKIANNSTIDRSILPISKSSKKSEFTVNAKNVATLISKLKDFLMENRREYINAGGFFDIMESRMTDLERDQIDTEAEIFMKKCKEAIKQLRVQAEGHKVMMQVREHKDGVLNLLQHYLLAVCRLYSEQKAIRVKRAVDRKRISRLLPDPILSSVKPLEERNNQSPISDSKSKTEITEKSPVDVPPMMSPEKSSPSFDDAEGQQGVGDGKENYMSQDENLLLQLENEQIFNEMSTMTDEIKQIEGKIVEISRLQNIFTEKVLEQEKDIDKVAEMVVGTSENIKEANEAIREAMKNNAGLRVWILFFLIVFTFSLLFLDWYNP